MIDLKNLTLTCHTFRTIVASKLFSTIYVSANERSIDKASQIGKFPFGSEAHRVVLLFKIEDMGASNSNAEYLGWDDIWDGRPPRLPQGFKTMVMRIIHDFQNLKSIVIRFDLKMTLEEFLEGLNGSLSEFYQLPRQVLRDGIDVILRRGQPEVQAEFVIQSLHGSAIDASRASDGATNMVSHMSLHTDAEEFRVQTHGPRVVISIHANTPGTCCIHGVLLDFMWPADRASMTDLVLNSSTYSWRVQHSVSGMIETGGHTSHLRKLELQKCLLSWPVHIIFSTMRQLREVVMVDCAAVTRKGFRTKTGWTECCWSLSELPKLRRMVIERSSQKSTDEIVTRVTRLLRQASRNFSNQDDIVRQAARMFVYCSIYRFDGLEVRAEEQHIDSQINHVICAQQVRRGSDMAAWQML